MDIAGWTDDMSISLPQGKSAADVAKFVIELGLRGVPDTESERLLVSEFQLSPSDAALARDRSFGGLFRAGTGNPANCPDRSKDPIAWEAHQLGTRDESLFTHFYPEFAAAKTRQSQQSQG